jgi:adenosylhomocysteinase
MPVLRSVRERFAREQPLAGIRIGACLHVTTETANLVEALTEGGAEVVLCAANPLSTQDATAAALVHRAGATVLASHGEGADRYRAHIDAVVAAAPQITMDDGADIAAGVHAAGGELLAGVLGGTEETNTGAMRLRAMEAEGTLAFPVIAVNEARAADLFDTRYGTGQSTLDGIVRATHILLAGRVLVVVGFGRCGRGIALRARGAGARVVVCEVDPLRALEATMEGYEVLPSLAAAATGDVFVTATGGTGVLTDAHFAAMRDGAILANAGHFDVEIDLAALAAVAPERRAVRPLVEQHLRADGARLNLLAEGRVVNLAAAEGHPAAVMDLFFAAQALATEHLVRHAGDLGPQVQGVPAAIDRSIAALELTALGVQIDALTDEQAAYLHAWE